MFCVCTKMLTMYVFLFKCAFCHLKKQKKFKKGKTADCAMCNFCSLVCTQYYDGLGDTAVQAPADSFAS